MAMTAVRNIVRIDQDKCDGCGLCVPQCAEGAIRVVDGKARLVADNLCDGLGACLGTCPRGAIAVERRPAERFDGQAVEQPHAAASPRRQAGDAAPPAQGASSDGGCPGSMMRILESGPARAREGLGSPAPSSALSHWPVQLALVPTTGPIWQDADVLIAADCVPFALADFHRRLLRGRSLAIACPKLDDMDGHMEKLAAIFSKNRVKSVTVARMEVPCCGGIVRVVRAALAASGRMDLRMTDITVGIDGIISE